MRYLASVIDSDFTLTRKVVLAYSWRTIVIQELGFVCMSNLYFLRTLYRRTWGIIRHFYIVAAAMFVYLTMSHMRLVLHILRKECIRMVPPFSSRSSSSSMRAFIE